VTVILETSQLHRLLSRLRNPWRRHEILKTRKVIYAA
jgi:hypothetical protein